MNARVKPCETVPGADESTKLRLALLLAKRGLWIAPLMPEAKLPYAGESWKSMRSRDPDVIRQWFVERPDMNYAVNPGAEYVILDLDCKKGKDGVADLEAEGVEAGDFVCGYSETFTVKSPSGGEHRYFKAPFPVTNAHTLASQNKSIDVRGTAGYVVGPGCHTTYNSLTNTEEGEYTITKKLDILQLPEWIEPRLTRWVPEAERQSYEDSIEEVDGKQYVDGIELDQPDRIERATEWLKHGAKPAVEYRGGNDTTFRTFAWLREHAISSDLALELVAKHYNPRAITQAGDPSPWTYEELERIRDNAYKYAKREVSHVGGLGSLVSDAEIIATSQNFTTEELMQCVGSRADRQDGPESAKGPLSEHTFRGDELFRRRAKKEFVIPRVLPAYGYVGFIARRGEGKSTLMEDMAFRLAHDLDWHGQPAKRGWGALYLAGEDAEGVNDQIKALMIRHEIPELDPSRFIVMDEIVDLLNDAGVESVWIPHLLQVAKGRRFVVFYDTWQIATSSGKQNDDEPMQRAIVNVKKIAKALGGPAVIAAHPPKDKKNQDTWSGSGVMENHSQALWKLTKETQGLKFSVPRIKGTRPGYSAEFQFEEQVLGGCDEWGQPLIGLVPVKIGGEGHVMEQHEQARRADLKQAVTDAICEIILDAEERGERCKWTGRSISEAVVQRHKEKPLAHDPGEADTLARNFSPWYDRKLVEISVPGPNGRRRAITAKRIGRVLHFRIADLGEPDTLEP
ncbi:MAG: AAA family ATPase [Alphaproteobacteria bacterium]|nr:AAA family ATPase [Alphaproteobacteria bacterium]